MKKSSPKYFTFNENLQKNKIQVKISELHADFPVHWHEYFAIETVLKGSGTIYINGKEYTAEQGDVFFLTPTDFHEIRVEGGLILRNISFVSDMLDHEANMLLSRYQLHSAMRTEPEGHRRVLFLLDEIEREKKEEALCCETVLVGLITQLLVMLVRFSNGRGYAHEDEISRDMQFALTYINNNIKGQISLNDVAQRLFMSPNYFSRQFHNEIGVSFKTYLAASRQGLAKKMLMTTNLPISSICNACGLTSEAHFIRAFKKQYGMPPGAYRKKCVKHKFDLSRKACLK